MKNKNKLLQELATQKCIQTHFAFVIINGQFNDYIQVKFVWCLVFGLFVKTTAVVDITVSAIEVVVDFPHVCN